MAMKGFQLARSSSDKDLMSESEWLDNIAIYIEKFCFFFEFLSYHVKKNFLSKPESVLKGFWMILTSWCCKFWCRVISFANYQSSEFQSQYSANKTK